MRLCQAVLCALVLPVFAPASMAGVLRFDGAPALFPSGHPIADVATGDFDGDGFQDAVAAVETGLVYFRGRGDGLLSPAIDLPGEQRDQVLAIDFERDGHAELIAAFQGSSLVRLLRGTASGLVVEASYDLGFTPLALGAADLSGDGIPDLVASGENEVAVLLGRSEGHLGASRVFPEVPGRWAVLADLNHDGHPDLASHGGSYYGFLTVLLGDGSGGFGAPRTSFTTLSPGPLVAADLTGDGNVDLAFTGGFTNTVLSILPGLGDGTFSPAISTAITVSPSRMIARDLDQDGRMDLLAAGGIMVVTLHGTGGGAFTAGQAAVPPWYVAGIGLADFDGDGLADVVAGSRNELVVMKGRADGNFGNDRAVPTGNRPQAVTTGDFNADGHLDLVTANFDGGSLSLLAGRGDGSFLPRMDLPVRGPVYPFPIDVRIADLNEDGRADLAFTQSASGGVSVFLQQPGGAWGPQMTYPTGDAEAQEWRIAVADINGDRHLDVIAAGHYADMVSVLLGRGDGGFGPPRVYPIGGRPFVPAVADVDADGHPDVVVSGVGDGPLGHGGLWLMRGMGNGELAWPFPLHLSPTFALCVSDLTADGRPDVASWSGDGALIFPGDGAGGFGAPRSVYVGRDALWGIVPGDFDLDGLVDLAGVDIGVHSVTIADADNRWARSFGVRWNPTSIVTGDFDEDGRLDLAVANSGANSVSILLNRTSNNRTPVVRCRDVVVSGGNRCVAEASVDDGTFDPDGDAITLSQSPAGPYPVGVTEVALSCTDSKGATAMCAARVTVVDDTPPSLDVDVTPRALWPANHRLVAIHASVVSQDACGVSPSTTLVSIACSEPDPGLRDVQGAEIGTADFDFLLRAERQGSGPGRTYTICYESRDAAGNSARRCVTVDVGHDHRAQTASVRPTTVGDEPEARSFEASVEGSPSRGLARLRYALPNTGHVRVSIYDVAGHLVARPVDGPQAAGWHWSTFEGGGASQLYFYRVEWEGRAISGRIPFLR